MRVKFPYLLVTMFLVLTTCSLNSWGAFTLEKVLSKKPLQKMDEDKAFSMSAEVGGLLTDGNTNGSSITAKLTTRHELPNWSNMYNVEYFFKENERIENGRKQSVTAADKLFLSAQMEYKLVDSGQRLFVFGQYEEDKFKGIDYQSTVALGYSAQALKTEKVDFKYSVGPGVSMLERFESNLEDEKGFILRAALDYVYKFNEAASFIQTFSTEVNDVFVKSRAESSISSKLNDKLAMKLSLLLDHNSDVEAGIKPLDTKTSVTLVYQFF